MPDSAGDGQGPKAIAAKKGLQETELFIESIKMVDEVAINICPFIHAVKAADKAWCLDLGKQIAISYLIKLYRYSNIGNNLLEYF